MKQSEGERNFHVLYQLCAGSSDEEASWWGLPPLETLHYLNQSGCFTLSTVDDGEAFREMRHALKVTLDPLAPCVALL